MKRFKVVLGDGSEREIEASFTQVKNGCLLFCLRGTAKRPELVFALSAGAWVRVAELERCAQKGAVVQEPGDAYGPTH